MRYMTTIYVEDPDQCAAMTRILEGLFAMAAGFDYDQGWEEVADEDTVLKADRPPLDDDRR